MAKRTIKVLIQRADRLGDVIFTLPVLEHLRNQYPNAIIHYMTSPIGSEFLNQHPSIDKLVEVQWDKKEKPVHYFSLVRRIKKEKYDVYIALWNNPWMAWMGLLAGIPVRVGDKSNVVQRWAYNKAIFQDWNDLTRHQIVHNLDLVKPLYVQPKIPKLQIYTDPKDDLRIKHMIEKHLSPTKENIVMLCSTGGTNYPIPEKAVIEFIEKITKTDKYNIILAGVLSEQSLLKEIKGQNVLNVIGNTTLKELISIIKVADFYIGGDTGPSHIASLCNIPMIFFSPLKAQPPTRWGPRSDYFKIIRQEYRCSSLCRSGPCPPSCFDYVDGELLYHSFFELVDDISLQDKMDPKKRERYLQVHTYRVLYLYKTFEEFKESEKGLQLLREKGLVIFTFHLKGKGRLQIIRLIKIILARNINVIQGEKLPVNLIRVIRFIIGTVCQWRPPVSVIQKIHEYILLKEYLAMYTARWQKHDPFDQI